MKRIIALVLCLVLSLSLFAACGGNTLGEDAKQKTVGTASRQGYDPKDVSLTIGIPQNANVIDYDTNAYTRWLKEQTGFEIYFQVYQSGTTDYQAQLTSAVATGEELPDMLINFQLSKGAWEEYGEAGYFVDLAPYFNDKEDLGKEFWNRMSELSDEQQRYVVNSLTSLDGSMYAYGRIEHTVIDVIPSMAFINQKWLDKLGLKMPTNMDELHKVLIAFRDKDPNGNGKKDEVPMISSSESYSSGSGVAYFVNMFTAYDRDNWFNVDENNQLYLPQLTDEYREALILMSTLRKEGLIFNSMFTMGNKEVKGMINPPKGEDQTVGVFLGHPSLVFEPGNDMVYDYEAMPVWGYSPTRNQAYTPGSFITSSCQYPEAAWDLMMLMTTKESSYRQRYGEKGVDWVDAEPGSKSFLGQDAEYRLINDIWGTQQNSCWGVINTTILTYAENETAEMSENISDWQRRKYELMADMYNNNMAAQAARAEYTMPQIYVPMDVQDADSNVRSNSQTVMNTAVASFVCGTGDKYNDPTNDAQWAAFIAEVESQGYKEWMEHRQALYEQQFPDRMK